MKRWESQIESIRKIYETIEKLGFDTNESSIFADICGYYMEEVFKNGKHYINLELDDESCISVDESTMQVFLRR